MLIDSGAAWQCGNFSPSFLSLYCRWGFLQFSMESVNSTKFHYSSDKWSVYTNLVQVYDAERVSIGTPALYDRLQ